MHQCQLSFLQSTVDQVQDLLWTPATEASPLPAIAAVAADATRAVVVAKATESKDDG